jgi:O-antigen/teichoic acid export membrane protein
MIGLFIFDYIITFFDRLSLAYFMGSSTVGMYGANFDLIKQILLFLMIIQSFILYPQINKAYETGDNKQLNKLLTFNLNIFLTVFIPLSLMVIYFNQFISEIFIGDKFTEYSPQLIPLFAVMFFIWGTKIYHFDYYFQLKEKTHYPMLILGLGSMLNIGFNILLIPKYGILGAAYATIIVYFVIFILSVMISKKLIKIDFKLSILIKVVIFLSLSIAAVNLPLISDLNVIFKIMIFLAAYSLLTLKYNFKELKPHLKSIYN